jgi:hypothetical protein
MTRVVHNVWDGNDHFLLQFSVQPYEIAMTCLDEKNGKKKAEEKPESKSGSFSTNLADV